MPAGKTIGQAPQHLAGGAVAGVPGDAQSSLAGAIVGEQARDIVVAAPSALRSCRLPAGKRPAAAIAPSAGDVGAEERLLAEHHLEAVVVGRVVRARHHEPAIDPERVDREIEHRRRSEPDAHDVDAGCRRARRPAPPRAPARKAARRGRPPRTARPRSQARTRSCARSRARRRRPSVSPTTPRMSYSRRMVGSNRWQAAAPSRVIMESIAQQYSARMRRTSSAISGRASAKAMLACRNPTLSPQSKRVPSKRKPMKGRRFRPIICASASVSWISPPAPRVVRLEMLEHVGLEDIAADDAEGRGRGGRLGLLDHALHLDQVAVILGDVEDAVAAGVLARHVHDGDIVAVEPAMRLDHLLEARRRRTRMRSSASSTANGSSPTRLLGAPAPRGRDPAAPAGACTRSARVREAMM